MDIYLVECFDGKMICGLVGRLEGYSGLIGWMVEKGWTAGWLVDSMVLYVELFMRYLKK